MFACVGLLLSAPHLLHCPVSLLVLMKRKVFRLCFNVITKSLPLTAVVPRPAHVSVCVWCLSQYPEPGPAALLHVPPAFYSARFCSAENEFCGG